jgi:hypothetical protein
MQCLDPQTPTVHSSIFGGFVKSAPRPGQATPTARLHPLTEQQGRAAAWTHITYLANSKARSLRELGHEFLNLGSGVAIDLLCVQVCPSPGRPAACLLHLAKAA